MHIFLYEWATGGGLVEEPGSLPASLVVEGTTMIGALAADFVKIPGCRVSALRDPRVLQLALHGCEVIDVTSGPSHNEEFEALAARADATILIAPEFDGNLLKAANRVLASGGRLASPSPQFIRISTNKQVTCETLSAANVPATVGVVLEPDAPLPVDFNYPAVVKPIDGAGSQDTYIVSGRHDAPPAYAWQRRIEKFMPGMHASVSVLCGPTAQVPLAPCKQRLSNDGRLRYLGGELPLSPGLAERATLLARNAIAALPSTTGYIGVDMVLGGDPYGSEDAVVEINPRLTTSYVGLRAASKSNLAEGMWRIVQGESLEPEFSEKPIEFDSSGNVSFIR
jgi:predicted ATP-grasp superfamily ATP-dependent carboligase